jgi:hypothetical protein
VSWFGRSSLGVTPVALAADTKRAARFHMPVGGNVAKASVYLDGHGGGSAEQVARVALYDALNALLTVSDEVAVAQAQAAGWVDFPFTAAAGKVALASADYYLAVHGGATNSTIRLFTDDPHGAGGQWNADTYSDGASNPFGAATALTSNFSAFVTYFLPFVAPVESDLYYSRLPLPEGQAVLGSTGIVKRSAIPVQLGWHSTFTDPEMGSNALVRDGGPLMGLLGERIRITTHGKAAAAVVYAYVHGVMPAASLEDLSVTRLLYSQLSSLSDDNVKVVVEVMT